MNAKSLEDQALTLPAEERAKLAMELIASLNELPSDEIQTRWLDEAGRRAQQLDEASVELISSDVVAAEARAVLRR